MKILVVGAGAVGGYFGGRLLEKGEDVTFLVREKRKKELEEYGLIIESVNGNFKGQPKAILKDEKNDHYDCIILSTKAYHLQAAIEDIRPFVEEGTVILPLLNGISHLDLLIQEFGEDHVIGGLCFIETTLGEKGKIIQTSPAHQLVFGERDGKETERILRLRDAFANTKADFVYSENIVEAMWEKYLFISLLSGATTLTRSPIGPIRDTEEGYMALHQILNEAYEVMKDMGAPLNENHRQAQLNKIQNLNASMKSSMQRDMEKGLPTEADHFFLYLLNHARKQKISTPYLQFIYANLKV